MILMNYNGTFERSGFVEGGGVTFFLEGGGTSLIRAERKGWGGGDFHAFKVEMLNVFLCEKQKGKGKKESIQETIFL